MDIWGIGEEPEPEETKYIVKDIKGWDPIAEEDMSCAIYIY